MTAMGKPDCQPSIVLVCNFLITSYGMILSYVQVMMRDVADSKRLYNAVKSHPSVATSPTRRIRPQKIPSIGPVTALIISELFWPSLQIDKLELHPKVLIYSFCWHESLCLIATELQTAYWFCTAALVYSSTLDWSTLNPIIFEAGFQQCLQ